MRHAAKHINTNRYFHVKFACPCFQDTIFLGVWQSVPETIIDPDVQERSVSTVY